MASLTKLMTALLFVESRVPGDQVTVVSDRARRATGTRLSFRAGDRLTARDLLAATLVGSANDACLALAEMVAGTHEAFVQRMNARAAALGLAQTRFVNACGHDAAGHRSSARDLLALANVAVRQPELAALMRQVRVRVSTRQGRTWTVENRNEMIGRYPGAVGVKSGYTPAAGKCLIARVERDGRTATLVVLDAPDRWWGSVDVLDRVLGRSATGPATHRSAPAGEHPSAPVPLPVDAPAR